MANPVCTNATLNLGCFKGGVLNTKQRLAFRIWYLANELSVLGGQNYTGLIVSGGIGGLLGDTIQQFDKYSMDDMDAALTAIYYKNAIAAGANVSNVPNTTINSVKHMVNNMDTDTMQRMETFLLCKIGVHKTFPQ